MGLDEMDYGMSDEYTLSGGLLIDGDFTPLYVRKSTGDIVYQTDDGSRMMIAEISVEEPIDIPSEEPIRKGLAEKMYGDAIGVLYGKEGCYVIMSESVAELRPYVALEQRSGNIIEIDMNVVDVDGEE